MLKIVNYLEDRDEYTADSIFHVPLVARWSMIASYATSPEIGKAIDNAMEIIEKENQN